MKMKADAWNKTVQLALKRYIYERIYDPQDSDTERIKKQKQRKAQESTLFVSAIWHGLYPGYFVSFFHWALLLQISQELFRVQRNS
jgi:lysophospholipid acyltransferase